MNEKIVPLGARSLVKPYEAAGKTASGLIMDNTSNTSSAPVRGTIIVAGDTSAFKAGEEIMFRRYSIDDLKFITDQGEQVVSLVDDQDVLAKIIKKENAN